MKSRRDDVPLMTCNPVIGFVLFSVLAAQTGHAQGSMPTKPLTCSVEERDGGWEYTCGAINGAIIDESITVDDALINYLNIVEDGLGGRGKVRGDTASLKDLGVSGLRVTIDWIDQPNLPSSVGYVWGFQKKNGRSRLVSCIAEHGSATIVTCGDALRALIKIKLRSGSGAPR